MTSIPAQRLTSEPEATPTADACPYVIGDNGVARWSETSGDAWVGLLETYKRLTRQLDAELEAQHGLTLSSLETLGRLAAAEEGRLRLSDIAAQTGLSLSRMSRIVGALEARGLVRRTRCPSDARAIFLFLTDDGLALAREAQATHFAGVQERFFSRLDESEIATLAGVFSRFAPQAAEACTTSD